ncbi:MAG: hypothetical protein ACYS22_11840 [Planctomycetota bacterium]
MKTSSQRAVLLFALGLLVGGAGWLAWQTVATSPVPPTKATALDETGGRTRPDADPVAAPGARAGRESPRAGPQATEPGPSAGTDESEALASEPTSPLEQLRAEMEAEPEPGRDAPPIMPAQIVLRLDPPATAGRLWIVELSLSAEYDAAGVSAPTSTEQRLALMGESDGSLRFPCQPGLGTALVLSPKRSDEPIAFDLGPGQRLERSVKVRDLVAVVRGKIVDAITRAPIVRVQVEADECFGGFTDAEGRFVLQGPRTPETLQVRPNRPYLDTEVTIPPGSPAKELTIALERNATLTVQLRGNRPSLSQIPVELRVAGERFDKDVTLSSEKGLAAFEDLRPGRYEILLNSVVVANVQVQPGDELTIDVPVN